MISGKLPTTQIDHYYVYTWRPEVMSRWSKGAYFYERTCGTEEAAKRWVAEYNRRGFRAVYLTNHLIKGAFV